MQDERAPVGAALSTQTRAASGCGSASWPMAKTLAMSPAGTLTPGTTSASVLVPLGRALTVAPEIGSVVR